MTPLPIESLFVACPSFFAHSLLTLADRQKAGPGDWAKVVFDLPNGERRQIWLEVEWVDTNRPGAVYKGRLADHGYTSDLKRLFSEIVQFSASHIYRLVKLR